VCTSSYKSKIWQESKVIVFAFLSFFLAGKVLAQTNPVGLWRTIDESTGKPRAEVRIQEKNGFLTGTIVRSLASEPSKEQPTCNLCTDDRKDQPKLGLEIIRGVRTVAGSTWYEGGEILDPDNGKIYKLKMRISDDGKSLVVRGYIGLFYRTQSWERAQ
jgi:uncharacterized protein (DUF2147 family)